MANRNLSIALAPTLFALAGVALAAERAGVTAPVPPSAAGAQPAAATVTQAPQKPAAARPARVAATKTAQASAPAHGQDARPEGEVHMSGMSVLGNDDSPKSLVIVPWKASQLGDMPGLSRLLDDGTQPVDKEVFLRELSYYRIKTNSK